jgi:hypothetical protein
MLKLTGTYNIHFIKLRKRKAKTKFSSVILSKLTCQDGIRESMKRRELKDEECMDRDFGEEKSSLWVEENCVFTEKLLT